MKKKSLMSIVCGYEQGGTTLLTQILRQHHDINSGFEGGMLLEDNPRHFYQKETEKELFKEHWLLSEAQAHFILDTNNWFEMYDRLADVFLQENENFIFDKYPKYMKFLGKIMSKVPDIPAIVIIRDAKSVFNSWAKRKTQNTSVSRDKWINENLESLCSRYNSYSQGVVDACNNGFKEKICLVNYESLCINPDEEAKKIFKFLNIDYETSYIDFIIDKETNNLPKWERKIHGRGLTTKHINEFEDYLAPETSALIDKNTFNPFKVNSSMAN